MRKINIFLLIVILASLMILCTSCESVAVYQRPGWGSPAHARANGLRNKPAKTVVKIDVDN